jgi:23S rRNA (cytidine2498-2'-O)-methyltransferase
VFARQPEDAPGTTAPGTAAAAASEFAAWQALGPGGPAELGELVADVIVAPVRGEPAWLGVHRHDRHHLAHPGGAIPVEVPGDAPSRAYAKIEEAIVWAELPIAAGHVALEIGAAPGGAVLALARRGLAVWGVDTGELAPNVRALSNVHHVAKKVGALRWEDLPPRIDWLLVDVNLAPQVALHEVARLMPRLAPTLRGAVFTLKLNDWAFVAKLPVLVERIRQMGLPDVRMRHLPSNRREICAVALR